MLFGVDLVSDFIFIMICDGGWMNGDLNGDCYIDLSDFAILAAQWLECGNPFDENCYD